MKYTNKLNLPSSIAQAVMNDPYTRGKANISVTGLIGPARKRRLEMDHADEMVTDVADRVWSLYGQIVHGILERADLADDAIVAERRLFIKRHGWTLSGQFDRLILAGQSTLQDYKFTSVYAVMDGVKQEYEAQQNIYKLMLNEHGYHVDKMQIVAILRDWSKMRVTRQGGDYPEYPVVVMDVDDWGKEKTEAYITERLRAHGEAQTELPECTPEERWADAPRWKIVKKGNTRAERGHANYDSAEAAEKALAELGDKFSIVEVPSESKRCANYCEASAFCDQWNSANPNKLGL